MQANQCGTLAARVRAILRRYKSDKCNHVVRKVRADDLVLDLDEHEVTLAGHRIVLTALEYRILYILAMNFERVIPYTRLNEYVWGYHGQDIPTSLRIHISHIRQKLHNVPVCTLGID